MSFPPQVSLYKNTSLNSNIPNLLPPPSTPPPPPPPPHAITLPHCWGWGLTDVKCNGHSNGWPQGVAATHPLEKKQETLFVRKLQAANQRKSLHLHNSRFATDHTVLSVVRSLLKASPQLQAHTTVDSLQTTPYSLPSDYTSDHFLWSQISAKSPSYHTYTTTKPLLTTILYSLSSDSRSDFILSDLCWKPILSHLHNNKTTADHHTVFFVVRLQIRLYSLVSDLCQKPIPSHTYTTTKSLQDRHNCILCCQTTDQTLFSGRQISAKSPSHHTLTQQQNHHRPPHCILCCQTTDQTLFAGVRPLPIRPSPSHKDRLTADHAVFCVVKSRGKSSFNHSGTPKDSLHDAMLISKSHTIPEYHTTLKPMTFKQSHLTAENILADK